MITDIHTHNPLATHAVINLSPGDKMDPGRWYSVGIHPWDAHNPHDLRLLEQAAANPRVVAIGETGLDPLKGDEERQMELLMKHIELSEATGKPLILHVVKRHSEILRLRKMTGARSMWIIHGFRGKPQLARQLTDAGIYLSIGERFNPATVAAVDPAMLLPETDESTLAVEEIAARAGLPLRDLTPLLTAQPRMDD